MELLTCADCQHANWKTRTLFYLASHHLVSFSSMCKIVYMQNIISCLQQPFVCLNCVCLQRKQQVSPRAPRLMRCRCTRLHLTPRKLFSISGGKVWSVSTQRFLPYTFSGARIGTDQGRLERREKKGPCGGSGESIEFLPVEHRLSLFFFLQFFIIFFFGGCAVLIVRTTRPISRRGVTSG